MTNIGTFLSEDSRDAKLQQEKVIYKVILTSPDTKYFLESTCNRVIRTFFGGVLMSKHSVKASLRVAGTGTNSGTDAFLLRVPVSSFKVNGVSALSDNPSLDISLSTSSELFGQMTPNESPGWKSGLSSYDQVGQGTETKNDVVPKISHFSIIIEKHSGCSSEFHSNLLILVSVSHNTEDHT